MGWMSLWITACGLDEFVDHCGLDAFVDHGGLDELVDHCGLDEFVDHCGLDELVRGSLWVDELVSWMRVWILYVRIRVILITII